MSRELKLSNTNIAIKNLHKKALEYASKSISANTKRAYSADWKSFLAFCESHNVKSVPASYETIAHFLVHEAETLKHSTLQRRLSTICTYQRLKGNPIDQKHPVLQTVWKGIKKVKGTKTESKEAIWVKDLKKMIDTLNYNSLGNIRDRAILLFGYISAQRRDNIHDIKIEDLTFSSQGIVWELKRSKTDQEGRGELIAIPYMQNPRHCAVTAIKNWLQVTGIKEGYVFRRIYKNDSYDKMNRPICDATINRVVKRTAKMAGMDETKYGGHSLRIGFVSQARINGADTPTIQKVSKHRDERMIDHYAKAGDVFRNLASRKLRL